MAQQEKFCVIFCYIYKSIYRLCARGMADGCSYTHSLGQKCNNCRGLICISVILVKHKISIMGRQWFQKQAAPYRLCWLFRAVHTIKARKDFSIPKYVAVLDCGEISTSLNKIGHRREDFRIRNKNTNIVTYIL
jgi:hypothetical protein